MESMVIRAIFTSLDGASASAAASDVASLPAAGAAADSAGLELLQPVTDAAKSAAQLNIASNFFFIKHPPLMVL